MELATQRRSFLSGISQDHEKQPSAPSSSILALIADSGFGRGELAELMANFPEDFTTTLGKGSSDDTLLINAGFAYDSDVMFQGIARFLTDWPRSSPSFSSREELFLTLGRGGTARGARPARIIVNGADRFFGNDGTPVSVEFDLWLRCMMKADTKPDCKESRSNPQIVLLGTQRIKRFCLDLGIEVLELRQDDRPEDLRGVNFSYLRSIRGRFESRAERLNAEPDSSDRDRSKRDISPSAKAKLQQPAALDIDTYRRGFFEAYLSAPLLKALRLNCTATFEILRTMCFIGSPIEAAVLLYAPRVAAALRENIGADPGAAGALRQGTWAPPTTH